MYIHVIKYVFPFHRTRISTLSITCIHIIKYVHSFYYTHISVLHFVGVFIYAGTINRSPTAADSIAKMLLTDCDNVANTHEIGCEHSVRRRGRFIVPVSLHYQKRVFTSSNTCFHIIKYVFSNHRICVFTLLNMYIHFTTRTYPSAISWVFSYMRAR